MSLSVRQTGDVDADKAERILSGLMAPAAEDSVIGWLSICAALTADRKEDAMSSEVRMRAYATKLRDYPGDVVRKVLADWPDRSKWFPVWADLAEAMKAEMGIRGTVRDRVQDLLLSGEGS